MRRLEGKVALVTGGASGLGKAMALAFASEGARVVITDIDSTTGIKTAEQISCQFIQQDVTQAAHWESTIAALVSDYGGIDILVNNAGLLGSLTAASPESTTLEDWRRIFSVNVESVFLGCRHGISAMRHRDTGSIINMSSVAGLLATPYATAYGASKATVQQLTRSVAQHCALIGSKIRCNCLAPGIVVTPMWEARAEEEARSRGVPIGQVYAETQRTVPIREFSKPQDVANAAVFMASDEARHITGITLSIDGGIKGCDTYLMCSQPGQ